MKSKQWLYQLICIEQIIYIYHFNWYMKKAAILKKCGAFCGTLLVYGLKWFMYFLFVVAVNVPRDSWEENGRNPQESKKQNMYHS